jgi:hypothetical protein
MGRRRGHNLSITGCSRGFDLGLRRRGGICGVRRGFKLGLRGRRGLGRGRSSRAGVVVVVVGQGE